MAIRKRRSSAKTLRRLEEKTIEALRSLDPARRAFVSTMTLANVALKRQLKAGRFESKTKKG